jgi:hypothetical protein
VTEGPSRLPRRWSCASSICSNCAFDLPPLSCVGHPNTRLLAASHRYNLLHQAHPGQDLNAVGQYASTLELEHFQKFPNRVRFHP